MTNLALYMFQIKYSKPKLLRLMEVLKQYKPEHIGSGSGPRHRSSSSKKSKDPDPATVAGTANESEDPADASTNEPTSAEIEKAVEKRPRRRGHHGSGRGQSNNYSSYDDPNALCCAVFVRNRSVYFVIGKSYKV